jgi:hypothetical protein
MKKVNKQLTYTLSALLLIIIIFIIVALVTSNKDTSNSEVDTGEQTISDNDISNEDEIDDDSNWEPIIIYMNDIETNYYEGLLSDEQYSITTQYLRSKISEYTHTPSDFNNYETTMSNRANFEVTKSNIDNELSIIYDTNSDYEAYIELEKHNDKYYAKVYNNETDDETYLILELTTIDDTHIQVDETETTYDDIKDIVELISDQPSKYIDDEYYAEKKLEGLRNEDGNLPLYEGTNEVITIEDVLEDIKP